MPITLIRISSEKDDDFPKFVLPWASANSLNWNIRVDSVNVGIYRRTDGSS